MCVCVLHLFRGASVFSVSGDGLIVVCGGCFPSVHSGSVPISQNLMCQVIFLWSCPLLMSTGLAFLVCVTLWKTLGNRQHGNIMISLSVPVTGSSIGWVLFRIQFRQKYQQLTGFLAGDLENKTNANLAAVEQLKIPRYNHRCTRWMVTLGLLCTSQMAVFNYLLAEFMAVHATANRFIQQQKKMAQGFHSSG